jgi:hypothetical protein
MNPQMKNCQNCQNDFTIESDDFSFYEKIKVPPPTWCPSCRFQRRCLFRNERKLFRNTDAVTGKPILSLYSPEAHFPVYEDSYWISDKWDPLSYGVDFDRSRPFFEQLFELSQKVPRPRSAAINMIRSEYSGNAADLKDCYLVFNSNVAEDCAYGNSIDSSKACFDCSHVQYSERCYESFWLTKCYDTHFSSLCEDCVSVWFSKNCLGCTDCFGCVNLRNKSYHFFNEPLSKEEYAEKVASFTLSRWSEIESLKLKIKEYWLLFPIKYITGIKNYSCTGEYITHSKNVQESYLVRGGEDLKYVQYGQVPVLHDCMDTLVAGMNSELIYESSVCGWDSSSIRFCWECWDGGTDFEYSMFCRGVSHVFGSVGIHEGEYVILNKKYSKEEFFALRDEIRKHMDEIPYIDTQGRIYRYGEFFPPHFSPFAYNDTITPEHFPLSREEIISYGGKWYEVPKTEYQITKKSDELPDDIKEVSDSILREIIGCKRCQRAYRIIESELQFLRQNNISLPRFCVDCRHIERIAQRNKSVLYDRSCMCTKDAHDHVGICSHTFKTSYSPDRSEIIYCESCYQQEVM